MLIFKKNRSVASSQEHVLCTTEIVILYAHNMDLKLVRCSPEVAGGVLCSSSKKTFYGKALPLFLV